MNSIDIRKRFLQFFKDRDHAIIPSASLIPEDDPSVLFTTAGMQPLAPFLLGQEHPKGKRVVNVQKCVRTQDIEEVGDNTHDTFFEMLGNWSFGDYFKEEAITWSYEFLTDKDKGLGLDPDRLYVTCFKGNDDVPKDTESADIWKSLGVPEHRIYYLEENWWSPGPDGPCGPDTEMFYDVTEEGLGDLDMRGFKEADGRQQIVEIWNDVLMEYEKKDDEVVGKLSQQNVDTGAGLERLAMVLQGAESIFATDLFTPIMSKLAELKEEEGQQAERIVADHIRTASFIIAAGVQPDNTGRGYVLRRLLRRAVQYGDKLGIAQGDLLQLVPAVVSIYKETYSEIAEKETLVVATIEAEEASFRETLERGRKEFAKIDGDISGKQAFDLYQTHGLPLEITQQLAEEKGVAVDVLAFESEMDEHRKLSQETGGKQFAGGLADSQEETVKLHTATHLLNQALRDVLGDHVAQEGSNITTERLRFDFTHDSALTDEEIKKVEELVNEKIAANLSVECKEMAAEEAKEAGAIYLTQADYPDEVTVYEMAHPESHEQGRVIYSHEICMGPHVDNTGELGTFRIIKEESSSAGVRRIKAVLE